LYKPRILLLYPIMHCAFLCTGACVLLCFQLLEHRQSFVCLTQGASDNDYLRSYFSVPVNEFRLHTIL